MATCNSNGPVVNAQVKRIIETLRGLAPGAYVFFSMSDAIAVKNVTHRIHSKTTKFGCDLWDREYQVREVSFAGCVIVARGK